MTSYRVAIVTGPSSGQRKESLGGFAKSITESLRLYRGADDLSVVTVESASNAMQLLSVSRDAIKVLVFTSESMLEEARIFAQNYAGEIRVVVFTMDPVSLPITVQKSQLVTDDDIRKHVLGQIH